MIDLIDPYNRLESIFVAIEGLKPLSADECAIPIREIADRTGIPMEVLRSDLFCILEVAKYDYDLSVDGKSIWEIYENKNGIDKKAFMKDLMNGGLDEAKLVVLSDDKSVLIPLTGEESSIMDHILREHKKGRKSDELPFMVKDSYHFITMDEEGVNDTLYSVRNAIKNNKEIVIRRKSDGKKLVIEPVSLFYDATENIYAVLYVKNDGIEALRIDKIEYLSEGKKFEPPKDIKKRISILPNVWGLEFNTKPMNVRVRFASLHSNGNVGKKVRRDLERRTNGKLSEEGEYLIYEDKVYGKDAFLRWVFSYGSSAVIEKPKSLRNEVIKIIEKELAKQS